MYLFDYLFSYCTHRTHSTLSVKRKN